MGTRCTVEMWTAVPPAHISTVPTAMTTNAHETMKGEATPSNIYS